MSILARLIGWLGSRAPARPTPQPEMLSLKDWADLPTHHPRCR